ncbi:MAG: hypothetical protein WDO68_10970 [Gammaproteobacteria bacterium]
MPIKRMLLPAFVAMLLVPVARAEDSSRVAACAATVAYEGVDSRGRIVRLTISEPGVQASAQATLNPRRDLATHWSAHIGSGDAAEFQLRDLQSQPNKAK